MNRFAFVFFLVTLVFAQQGLSQNRFEGYNVIVDAPKNQRSTACAVRFVPPTTAVNIAGVNGASAQGLKSCSGSGSSLQSSAAGGSVRASAQNYKWCFEGEEKLYRLTFTGDNFSGPITYNWIPEPDPRNAGFYSIRDFGAVGDGKADDSVAFRSAMAYLASKNGGTLNIPNGDYIVTSPITLAPGIIIQGTNSLNSMAPGSDLARNNPSRIILRGSKKALFQIGECTEKIAIRDIELYAESNDGTSGVEAFGAYNTSQDFLFERVTFNNFFRGINAYALPQTNLNWQFDYVKVVGCRFIFNRDAGIFVNSRNTDWKIEGSLFVNPKAGPGQNAFSMHFERIGGVLIQDTFGGGLPNALGGTFLNILDSGPTNVVSSQAEYVTNAIIYNAVRNPNAGDLSHPFMITNSVFGDPIVFNARRTLVSTGNRYDARTFTADEQLRVYSTGDRFCFDGFIMGCRDGEKKNFDRANIVFMTGQPADGRVPGHPTIFGTDVQFNSPVQLPSLQHNAIPQGRPNGSMVYCANCRRNTTPCQAGGSGAPAMVVGGQWSCL